MNILMIRFLLIEVLFEKHENSAKSNVVFFEAQIQNITNSVLYMEHVQLLALKDTTRIEEITKTKTNVKNNLALIRPLEVKQYLFKIVYDKIEREERPLIAGKLDISWRNSLGENGRLQTHPLSQIVSLQTKNLSFYFVSLFNLNRKIL